MILQSITRTSRYLVLGGGAVMGTAAAYRYRRVMQREGDLVSQPLNVFATSKQNDKQKRVIVIGGGVVGVTTAYKLAKKGHSVAILEPATRVAAECSACAAGGMQKSNPVVDRDSWIAVTKCIAPRFAKLVFGSSPGKHDFKFFHIDWSKTLSDPFFLRWVLTFTKTSLLPGQDQHDKQLEMLKFTKFAVDDMLKMMDNKKDPMAKKSGFNSRGSVSVSYDPVQEAAAAAPAKASANPTSSKMSYEPCRQLVGEQVMKEEPSLKLQAKQPTSAKYESEAKSASSERFTKELAERCTNDASLDVSILYDTKVKAITVKEPSGKKPRIAELKTNRGVIQVPDDVSVVVAAGSWTPHVLALMNLYAPVYPLKGYAMSVSANEAIKSNPSLKPQDLPSRIVSDKYMYTTRLGDEIRITSIGEFSGWSTKPTPDVDAEFRHEAIRQLPQLQDLIESAATRCGHRPYVSDGILLLGAVDTHEDLYVSCGPGSNGWKLAMGSGEVIERLVAGQTTEEITKDLGFDANAFSPAGRVLKAPVFAKLCRARWDV